MQKHVGYLSAALFLGLSVPALAQTPSAPTPVTKYDGTYAFVSSTKVNETYMNRVTGRIGRCGERRRPVSLVIVRGKARWRVFWGDVGSEGELLMKLDPQPINFGTNPGFEVIIFGRIASDGTARPREISDVCDYDVVWQKVQR